MGTVITEKMTVNGQDGSVVLDGLDFTGNGYLEVYQAASIIIRNCRVYNMNVDGAVKNYWLHIYGDIPVKLVIEDCFFGNNPSGAGTMYNLIEPTAKLMDGSSISKCYFKADCCTHNSVNLYGAEEGANIFVSYNTFEMSAGTIRIGVKGEPACAIHMVSNTVLADNPNYGAEDQGLACIQPYGTLTTTFKNMVVNIKGTRMDNDQVFYGWYGSKDLPLTDEVMPKIYIGGELTTIPIYH